MSWRYISDEEHKVRRASLMLRRKAFAYRIMSSGAIKRSNDMLLLRHHLGSYQTRGCGTRGVV